MERTEESVMAMSSNIPALLNKYTNDSGDVLKSVYLGHHCTEQYCKHLTMKCIFVY